MKVMSFLPAIFVCGFLMIPSQPAQAKTKTYSRVLKHHTQSDSVYLVKNQLKADILWHATWLSPALLAAQAELKTKTYQLSAEESETVAKKLDDARDQKILYFVTFYSSNKKFADLTQADATWLLSLQAGGRTFRPLRFEKLGKAKPLDQLFYPYLDHWSEGYYVWFSAEADLYPKPWILAIHGTESQSELNFK